LGELAIASLAGLFMKRVEIVSFFEMLLIPASDVIELNWHVIQIRLEAIFFSSVDKK
jgi:hypothetical protein